MKKLNKEEAKDLMILRQGRLTSVHINLLKLQPGEALIIEKGIDWLTKNPPYDIIRKVAKQQNWRFTYGRTADGTGWIVKRET